MAMASVYTVGKKGEYFKAVRADNGYVQITLTGHPQNGATFLTLTEVEGASLLGSLEKVMNSCGGPLGNYCKECQS
jgi:hypothetical protein